MKVNLSLEITDGARNALGQLLRGKPGKYLATREEVKAFMLGTVAGLIRLQPSHGLGEATPAAAATVEAIRAPLTPAEEKVAAKLASEGKSPGYIRGWIYAGRRINAR